MEPVMTDRMCISCGNDLAEGEGPPLYAEPMLDAPLATWAHRMCLEPLPPSAEEIEAQAAALKAWADELRKALAAIERTRKAVQADTGPA
jgi:hypothetical protein